MIQPPSITIISINTVVKKIPNGNEVETTYGLCQDNNKIYKWDWKTGKWTQNWKSDPEEKE